MQNQTDTVLSSFFITGINYKRTDAGLRGKFAISESQYEQLLAAAPAFGVREMFVLSTCNRTELYGFADNAQQLAALLCSQTEAGEEVFSEMSYQKCGAEAIGHLFNVAAGLDSQILGDYQIVGQIKQSAKFAKERNYLGAYLERMINLVLQASKKIRTNTAISGGTVSVSFAAVQYIKEKFQQAARKNILLVGTGKIGTNTCKNLADYLQHPNVTLLNRSMEKAEELARQFNFQYASFDDFSSSVNAADIIIVATNAATPILNKEHLQTGSEKLIIDLSVPCNVSEDVAEINGIELVNVDRLSKIKDETLLMRTGEIPKVKEIIREHIAEFLSWHEMRKHVPILKHVKDKLLTIQEDSSLAAFSSQLFPVCHHQKEEKIQKVISGMASKMRKQHQPGCHYIEAINDFISTSLTR